MQISNLFTSKLIQQHLKGGNKVFQVEDISLICIIKHIKEIFGTNPLKENVIYHFFENCHFGTPTDFVNLVPMESEPKIRNMYQIQFLFFCRICIE